MSYRLSGFDGGDVAVEPGTSMLFSGPSKESDSRLWDGIADGVADGEAAIVITTNLSAERVVEALAERDAADPDRVGIVDCTSSNDEAGEVDGVPVRQLNSPGDLTGMSLEFAKLLQGFEERGVGGKVRVGVGSVSTLLMYAEIQTVFRFLHVFTSRIRSAELLGLFTIDPSMHDDQTTNTVRTIFDCEATFTEETVGLHGTGFSQG